MARIKGVKNVKRALQKAKQKYGDPEPKVRVGYTAAYALYVHEAEEMVLQGEPRSNGHGRYWDPQGRAQAKFLEQPFRELANAGVLKRIIRTALKKGAKLLGALMLAGLRVQRDSQRMCPVDTGNLRGSAFTRSEK